MLYKNILVPYDNSGPAHAALREAIRIAREDLRTVLHIVQIVDVNDLAREEMAEQNEGKGSSSLDDVDMTALLRSVVVKADSTLHENIDEDLDKLQNEIIIELIEHVEPGSQIVTYAAQRGCDLIVMGSRGLGRFRGILGSASSEVVRSAKQPVLIAK